MRAIGLPPDLFIDVAPKVVAGWRARAAVESPSHLRTHPVPLRVTLLAALLYEREREITDTLVELLISTVHRIGARAEKKVTEQFINAFKKVSGKENILFKLAEASLGTPEGTVRQVVFPAVSGGEATLRELVHEFKTRGPVYRRTVQTTLKGSYTNHYRRGLIKLLDVLEFRSSNHAHRPVIEALGECPILNLEGCRGSGFGVVGERGVWFAVAVGQIGVDGGGSQPGDGVDEACSAATASSWAWTTVSCGATTKSASARSVWPIHAHADLSDVSAAVDIAQGVLGRDDQIGVDGIHQSPVASRAPRTARGASCVAATFPPPNASADQTLDRPAVRPLTWRAFSCIGAACPQPPAIRVATPREASLTLPACSAVEKLCVPRSVPPSRRACARIVGDKSHAGTRAAFEVPPARCAINVHHAQLTQWRSR